MGIEDLKRWHWIAIGLLVGLGLSYVWTSTERQVGRNNLMEFVRDVNLRVDPKTGPLVRNIVVHPPEENFEARAALESAARKEAFAKEAEDAIRKPPPGDRDAFIAQKQAEAAAARADAQRLRADAARHRVNVVTYDRLMQTRDGKSKRWVAQSFIAEIPFKLPGRGGRNTLPENITVEQYLESVAQSNPGITWRRAWWNSTPLQYAIWTIGSVIAIGVLWPNVLMGLIGAGYGRKTDDAKRSESLWSYKSRPEPTRPATVPKGRAADDQQLIAMTDQLERNLAAVARQHGDGAVAGAASDATVRKLEGGPLEAMPVPTKAEEDEIEVKGEYYPVLIHHKKPHHKDEEKGDGDTTS